MLIAAPSHGRQGLVAVHLILFSVLPLGALAASDQATDERKGRAIVQINCATCHAVGRQGDSPMAKALPFRDLHKRYPVENLQEALGEGIATWSLHDAGVQVRTEAGGRDHRLPEDTGTPMTKRGVTTPFPTSSARYEARLLGVICTCGYPETAEVESGVASAGRRGSVLHRLLTLCPEAPATPAPPFCSMKPIFCRLPQWRQADPLCLGIIQQAADRAMS